MVKKLIEIQRALFVPPDPTPADLDAFLDKLVLLEGVERTQTTMVLRTNAERPTLLPFERG